MKHLKPHVKQLLIRADATAAVGSGHLMRCLALAQAAKFRGVGTTFIAFCDSDDLHQRLVDEGFGVVALKRAYPDPADWNLTSKILRNNPEAWVVIDGYCFDGKYQRQINDSGNRTLIIDDYAHLDYYWADILLNQNIYAKELQYGCSPQTRLLMGSQYVLLRAEFLRWQKWQRQISARAKRVLVTLGGGDFHNVTLKVVNIFKEIGTSDLELTIVAGASNPHLESLRQAAFDTPFAIKILRNVKNMPELMGWADMAVTAAGSTCWEMSFMGLPALVIILAANQEAVAEAVQEAGVAVNLGWYQHLSTSETAPRIMQLIEAADSRAKISARGRTLVDGKGVERVLSNLFKA